MTENKVKIIGYNDAKEIAEKLFESIDSSIDFMENGKSKVILVQHSDRSRFEFHSACFRRIHDNWMAIFTEHHGVLVYHEDDVDYIKEYLEPETHYYNIDN